jgi:CBS domain-containing protein
MAMLIEQMLPVARDSLVVISEDALLMEAAKLLSGRHINLLVVCNKLGAMVGVITKTDIVRQIGHCQGSGCTAALATAMTRDVAYCFRSDFLRDVWAMMKERGFFHIPLITKDFMPLGIINARDALLVLLEETTYEEELLRDYVMSVGYH